MEGTFSDKAIPDEETRNDKVLQNRYSVDVTQWKEPEENKEESNKQEVRYMKKTRIAYCIPALYYPSGMERVLTLKVNYLVQHGYARFISFCQMEGTNLLIFLWLLPLSYIN